MFDDWVDEWVMPICLGLSAGMLFIAVLAFASHTVNQFEEDCVASGGKYTEIASSQYCELRGEVYLRR